MGVRVKPQLDQRIARVPNLGRTCYVTHVVIKKRIRQCAHHAHRAFGILVFLRPFPAHLLRVLEHSLHSRVFLSPLCRGQGLAVISDGHSRRSLAGFNVDFRGGSFGRCLGSTEHEARRSTAGVDFVLHCFAHEFDRVGMNRGRLCEAGRAQGENQDASSADRVCE